MEFTGSSWGSVFVPAGHVRSASGGSGHGSGASSSSSRHLPTFISPQVSSNDRSRALQMPQVNNEFLNVNIENVTERSR